MNQQNNNQDDILKEIEEGAQPVEEIETVNSAESEDIKEEEIKTDKKVKRTNLYRAGKSKPIYKRVWFWIVAVILSLVLIFVATAAVLINVGRSKMLNIESMKIALPSGVSDAVTQDDGLSIEYKGKRYMYNEDMTAILCMGIDKESISKTDGIGKNGQADALFLYAMDTKTGKSTIIPIPRDTIADVDLYSGSGAYVSQSKKQICLSYAYGDGKEKSCVNTVKSVSRLFYGLQINSYAAIDLKAVEILTDKLDGITVTSNETFDFGGHYFYKDKSTKITSGKQARVFIQERGDELDSSLKRMERQKRFLTAFFAESLSKTKEDITFPIDMYSAASDYTVTNIDVSKVSFLASCVVGGEGSLSFKSFKGEMKMGAEHAEYYVDEQSVFDVLIDVFYKQVK